MVIYCGSALPNDDVVQKRKLALCVAVYYLGFGSFVPNKIKRLSEVYTVIEYLLAEKEIAVGMFDPILDAVLPDLAGLYGQIESWWAEFINEEKKNRGKLFVGLRRKKGRGNDADGM